MIAAAPASASISAEISPVCAPDGLGWQSWAPTATAVPRALSAKAAIRVAGGQTRRSALAATAGAPASMAANSPSAAFSPFIFQLPAIRGRMASVMVLILRPLSPRKDLPKRLAEVRDQFQIGTGSYPASQRLNATFHPWSQGCGGSHGTL